MDKEIISFEMLQINRGRGILCTCKQPQYEIDSNNRLVMCVKCGAVIEPFEALQRIAQDIERLNNYQKRAIEKAKVYEEEADKEINRMCRNRVFRDMEAKYRKNLLPECPICRKYFDPVKIVSWTNRKFVEENNG